MADTKRKSKIEKNIPVYNADGTHTDSIELPKEIFNIEVNNKLLAQYVRVYLYNNREYNASTKTRGEVTGSTRKIYRQKGTGRARHGSIKAPVFVGGGVVFGPRPRNNSLQMNKKQKQKALLVALSQKAHDGAVMCVSNEVLHIDPKTKNVSSLLVKMGVQNKKNMIIIHSDDKNTLSLGARNIPYISVIDVGSINPYSIINTEILTFTKEAIEVLKKRFLS